MTDFQHIFKEKTHGDTVLVQISETNGKYRCFVTTTPRLQRQKEVLEEAMTNLANSLAERDRIPAILKGCAVAFFEAMTNHRAFAQTTTVTEMSLSERAHQACLGRPRGLHRGERALPSGVEGVR